MSILFTEKQVAGLTVKNRFVHSGTGESMATDQGAVTDRLIKRYKTLAKGEVGLIVTGYMSVHPLGRATLRQTGIHSDAFLPGLEKLAQGIHDNNGRVLFQLVHAGRQTTSAVIGEKPAGPSATDRDPTYLVKPRMLTHQEIVEIIDAYKKAAIRAMAAGADGIHISAAGGYLINQFLSPFYNQRDDEWGGTTLNRFRLLREIVIAVKEILPSGAPLVVKINTDDQTPRPGIILDEAMEHAKWLVDLGIDGIEVASGNLLYNHMTMWHGEVPTKEIVQGFPTWKKPFAWVASKRMEGQLALQGPWNLPAAQALRPVVGDTPLFLVGGLREVGQMESILEQGHADFIQMCRPFIREPFLVKKIKAGKVTQVACTSCNRCLGAIVNQMPIACYRNGLPATAPSEILRRA
ncbi:MAG: NADH:flavin oxidoreductase [Desulfatibacillum sp.]|nr:NADH:flavin oxidoreductase [Desulfatibacillum sp.]